MPNLILTRKPLQKIYIGNEMEISVCVVDIRGNQVRIAIDAKKNIPIVREELIYKLEEGI